PLRKIGARKERLPVRREEHRERPAALPRQRLANRHVDMVDVGPLLPVHLDRHEGPVEQLRHLFILERFPFHHMTPMTGRYTQRSFLKIFAPRRATNSRWTKTPAC